MKKGISLVALVITIVVLVILTGAVIITTIDSNIMGNTQTTVDMYNKKAIIEDINMKIQTAKLKKVNQGIYKLTMTDIIPIIQTYGDFDNTTLKLTTTTTTKPIEIWLYEIMNIPLEEYATISYINNILTITTQLPSDLYRVQYTTSGGTSWDIYNSPVTIAQESGIQIRLLNIEGTVVSNTLKLTNGYAEEIDNTNPSITIEPNGIGLAKEMQVTITVTDDNELATNTYEYCLIQSQITPANNSSEWKPYTNGEAFTIGTGLTETYYLHVKAVNDVAGNTSGNVVSESYTFDNTPPYNFIPVIGEVTETSIQINASTTDNNTKTVTYEYSIDNGKNWQTSNTFTGLIAGTTYNQIKVKAIDTVENERIVDVETCYTHLILYDNGNQYTNITGGWTNGINISIWGNGHNNAMTKIAPNINTDRISMNLVGQSYFKYVDINTVNKIDVTNYSTVKCLYNVTSTLYGAKLVITSNLDLGVVDTTVPVKMVSVVQSVGNSYLLEVDISDIIGQYYIRIFF